MPDPPPATRRFVTHLECSSTGARYPADELCVKLTGTTIRHEPLIRHLRSKLEPIYQLG